MDTQNLVLDRIKRQKKRSTSMLSSWMQNAVLRPQVSDYGDSSSDSVTTAPEQKKQDFLHRDRFSGFAKMVSQKYQEAKQLVPQIAKFSQKTGFWGEMERIFPGTAAETGRREPSAQPGEMRSGTIIQKFDMFPKPGQPIAAFKAQSEQISERQHSKPAPVRQNKVLPGQRLFTKVTEITPKSETEPTFSEEEMPEIQEKPRVFEKPAQFEKEPEVPSESVEPALPEPQVEKPSSSLEKKPEASKAVDLPLKQAAPPIRTEKTQDRAVAKPSTLEKSKMQAPQPSEVEKPLKALPVHREKPQPIEKPKALPAIPTERKLPQMVSKQSPISNKVVQRTTDLPVESVKEEFSPRQQTEPSHTPVAEPDEPQSLESVPTATLEELTMVPQHKTNQSALPLPEPAELPLKQQVEQRMQFAKDVIRSKPANPIKPVIQPAIFSKPAQPLISLEKYQLRSEVKPEKEQEVKPPMLQSTAPSSLFMYAPAQIKNTPQQIEAPKQKFISDMEYRQIPSFTQENQMVNPPTQTESPISQPLEMSLQRPPQMQEKSDFRKVSNAAQQSSHGVVQRDLDSGAVESSASPQEPADLRKLADDVFPFVKRLLEIERERTRGSLR